MKYKLVQVNLLNEERHQMEFKNIKDVEYYLQDYITKLWIFDNLEFDIIFTVYENDLLIRYISQANKFLKKQNT